ncbi:hypothetical protein HPP92_022313 [Vanilla planifolia]|uniref:Uncharacterized protein n=1 Tax=Vanilla planifolia TaxID=51239 RepID=A0A835PRS4_VANPL|nr:hypothetical protein HPP92_022313 [Vanilla planifolia]
MQHMCALACMQSWAQESLGHLLTAIVDEEAEVDGQVEANAEDVSLQNRTETHGRLQVCQAFDEAAARRLRRLAEGDVDETIEHVGAPAKLDGVDGALARRVRSETRWAWLRRLRRWRTAAATGHRSGRGEEE